jgi:protein-disulfide isomerase
MDATEVKDNLDCKPDSKKRRAFVEKFRDNPWMIATLVLGVLLIGFVFSGSITGSAITGGAIGVSKDTAVKNFEDFAQSKGIDVTVSDVNEKYGLYAIDFSTDEGGESTIYISNDGLNIVSVQGIIPMTADATDTSQPNSKEIPKTDKPVVELFVMTFCPYGTQAEKGFIPVMKILENVADVKIRFVHYFMHGDKEKEETQREVCIREEQNDKYLDYLTCFLEGDGVESNGYIMNGNDPSTCMQRVGVDEEKVTQCVDSGKWEDYYNEDSELSHSYGVEGSPTLVINGVIANSGRDSESFLDTVCSAFNNAPQEECMTELSSVSPSVYFGWDGVAPSSGSDALCS